MGMEGLGRVFNVIALGDNIHVPLKAGTGVAFVIYENGGDNQATIQEGIDGGSAQDLAVVDRLYTSSGVGGAWTLRTQTAAALVQKGDFAADAEAVDCAVIQIRAEQLSDGFNTVACNVDAGTVTAILYDLTVQRDPANLAALV